MSDTHDSSVLFNTNVAELGDLIARLGQAITAADTLALRDRIVVTLASAGLGWRDLAERVVASRPARVEPLMAAPPPMPMAALRPTSDIKIDPMKMLTNDELLRLGGYRSGPVDIEPDASAKPAATDGVMSAAELSRYGYLRKPGTPFGYSGAPGQDASTSKPDQA